ncbi:MAG: hypothetical protein JXQ29_15480 [Planctomycetes bacterium]|nr:hypothetical protein [Planctomycetota bacterium]
MKKEQIRDLAADPRLIPGVYHYCDHWCARCGLTARCLRFRIEDPPPAAAGGHEPPRSRGATPAAVTDSARVAADLLAQIAADEEALDLEAGCDAAELEDEFLVHPLNSVEVRDCVEGAVEYATAVDHWFLATRDDVRAKIEALTRAIRMGLPGADPAAEGRAIEEAMQVVRWDQHVIFFKLTRAVTGAAEEEDPAGGALPENDADGSVKVALLSMDRSIEAWRRLGDAFPDRRDETLDLVVLLDRLRTRAESLFPGARAFVRPGFDREVGAPA